MPTKHIIYKQHIEDALEELEFISNSLQAWDTKKIKITTKNAEQYSSAIHAAKSKIDNALQNLEII